MFHRKTILVAIFALAPALAFFAVAAQAGFYVIPVGKVSKNTVVVSHNGNDTESGDALLAALADITDASETKPYRIVAIQ